MTVAAIVWWQRCCSWCGGGRLVDRRYINRVVCRRAVRHLDGREVQLPHIERPHVLLD